MFPNPPIGSRDNPFQEVVLLDAILTAKHLGKTIYAHVEDNKGLYKVYPDGDAVLLRTGNKRVRRKEVAFSTNPWRDK